MKCPKCDSKNVYVINAYSAGPAGTVQRRKCADCGATITTQVVVLSIEPKRGEGAYSVAKRLRAERPRDDEG
jgi:transcriptional regulator NrdR family protein